MASLRDIAWHWWLRLHSGAVHVAHLSLAALRESAWRWWLHLHNATAHVTRLLSLGPSTRPSPIHRQPAPPGRSVSRRLSPSLDQQPGRSAAQQQPRDSSARHTLLALYQRRITWHGDPHERACKLVAKLMVGEAPDPKTVPAAVLNKALIVVVMAGTSRNIRDHVVWLLAAGADVHAEDDRALRWASGCDNATVIDLLLAAGANVHAENDEALRDASAGGQLDIVERLLAAGADLHADDDEALRRASAQGCVRIVERLLAAGANVHACNDAALVQASDAGHLYVVKQLLAHGASVNADRGRALTRASANGHLGVVEQLLAAGADINFRALYWASIHDQMAVLDRLLAAAVGTDLTVRLEMRNAMVAASDNGQVDVVARFLAAGVPPTFVPWSQSDHLPHWRALLLCVGREHVAHLPDEVQFLWRRLHLCICLPLRAALFRARVRLDRPPTTALGVERPTRAELIAHLRTAGLVFAREYWTEGLPLFFPGQDFGPLPDDFIFQPRIAQRTASQMNLVGPRQHA